MVADGNQTYHDDHFVMDENTESLCHGQGTNSVVGQLYLRDKVKEKRLGLW